MSGGYTYSRSPARWPSISYPMSGFLARFLLVGILYYFTEDLTDITVATGTSLPEEWLIWDMLLFISIVIFLPEISTAISFVLRVFYGILSFFKRYRPLLKRRVSGFFTFTYKAIATFLFRIVSYPIRTYFKPTPSAVLTSFALHLFIFGFATWLLESIHQKSLGGAEAPIGKTLFVTLWELGRFYVNQSLDLEPLSLSAKLTIITGLISFLFMSFFYVSAFLESRDRLTMRRLKNKPRLLPMSGHLLVAGDLATIRMLLHQFEYYGFTQDIVVAAQDAASNALVGLNSLEPYVWAVDGNLWEKEVRDSADVNRAASLVVTGTGMEPLDATRAVSAVEADNGFVNSYVDTRSCQKSILDKALAEPQETDDNENSHDCYLNWPERQPALKRDLQRVPHLSQVVTELVSYQRRSSYPKHFNLVNRFNLPQPLKKFADSLSDRFLNLVPLSTVCTHQSTRSFNRLCVEGESVLSSLYQCLFGRRSFFKPPVLIDLNNDPQIELRSVYEDSVEYCDFCKSKHRRYRKNILEDLKGLSGFNERNPAASAAQIDNFELGKLCDDEIWNTERSICVELNEPDAASSFLGICHRNGKDDRVDAYSDLELRTLWLALLTILGEPAREFLDALWPSDIQNKLLGFQRIRLSREFFGRRQRLTFGRVSRIFKENCILTLAVRMQKGDLKDKRSKRRDWVPCAFGYFLYPKDEILVLRKESDIQNHCIDWPSEVA